MKPVLILVTLLGLGLAAGPCVSEPFVAYSLREAQSRVQSGQRDAELMGLGGIRRIVGMVQDPDGDIILVGRAIPTEPAASLTDLAVALRARLLLDAWPLVSIDPVEHTAHTGLQQVRFDGGIAHTAFGRDFLLSDIWLKEYSLQLLPERPELPSLRRLVGQSSLGGRLAGNALVWSEVRGQAAPEAELHGRSVLGQRVIQARFWFTPAETRVLVRDGVFAISALRIKVEVEDLSPPSAHGPRGAGEPALAFAAALTEHMDRLREVPAIARLKILFDLTQVAEGIRGLASRPSLEGLMSELPLERIAMADALPLVRVVGRRLLADGSTELISLSGGVRFQSELRWLARGDITPLRRIVLDTRPTPDALTWPLPLSGWSMPNADDLPRAAPATPSGSGAIPAGMSIVTENLVIAPDTRPAAGATGVFRGFTPAASIAPLALFQTASAPDALGGVSMQLRVDRDRFRSDPSLDALRDLLLRRAEEGDRLILPLPIR